MLKLLELQHNILNNNFPTLAEGQAAQRQLTYLNEILILFKNSTLIIDEVDSVCHVAKSELNFPISQSIDLDASPIRWQLAMHLLDGILYYTTQIIPTSIVGSKRGETILNKLYNVLNNGVKLKYMSTKPHLILLNQGYYYSHIQPILVEWILLFLDGLHLSQSIINHDDLRVYFSLNLIVFTSN
eukprot:UN02846